MSILKFISYKIFKNLPKGINHIVLLDSICTSKDYKCSFDMEYEDYPLKKYN